MAALVAAGHTVEVIAAGAGADIEEAHDADAAGAAVTVKRLPARFGDGPSLFDGGAPEALERGAAGAVLAAARFVATLTATVRARAPRWHRIESHWLAPSALAAVAAAPDLSHRAHAHSGDVALLERMPFGRTLARHLVASGAELLFASEALRRRFAALAGTLAGSVELSRPPARLFAWAPRPRAGRPTILSVGRLVPIKGYDLLLHACARARLSVAADVVIVGDGPERERLRQLGDRLGLSLRLPGAVPRPEVASWLRAADVYVQPSRVLVGGGRAIRTEGTPVATLEALAVGLPVIAAASGGLAELPERGAPVRLFPPDDVGALAALLEAETRS